VALFAMVTLGILLRMVIKKIHVWPGGTPCLAPRA